ncbi:hypothetical protein SCUCBS95973_004446 [Sporothrix curviconia]|uniref:Alpha-ketoglutarate-dependent sulfonate dioxygenase n=1 Tax=Sporothrix curviconia TaxID=1260050 RepID=A0ABP0BP43_9PEZI
MAPWSRKKSDASAPDAEKAGLTKEKSNRLSLFKTNDSSVNGGDRSNGSNANANANGSPDEALPAYSAEPPQEPTVDDIAALTAVLSNLNLPREPKTLSAQAVTSKHDDNSPQYMWPSADECLAHLKFLFAVHALKEDVGYTDGMFGLHDAIAGAPDNVVSIPLNLPDKQAPPQTQEDLYRARLSKVREKRWALYVARAADRYDAWWTAVTAKNRRPEEGDMEVPGNRQYSGFVDVQLPRDARVWNADNLLPLDVWMVMHAHMLNPRAFLEDCIRYGARDIWAAGMPWAPVSEAIDNEQFQYRNVSDTAKASWTSLTGHAWDNVDDPPTKEVKCPACYKLTTAPWTTWGTGVADGDNATELLGTGYGDGGDGFEVVCKDCGFVIDRKALAVGKFVFNCLELIRGDKPMPGTILDPKTGRPEVVMPRAGSMHRPEPRTFPNRVIKRGGMMAAIVGGTGNGVALKALRTPPKPALIDRMNQPRTTSMEMVKSRIEEILGDSQLLKYIDEYYGSRFRYRPQEMARLSIRKMMSRYWDNASPFALDLTGAVLRQGIFIDKMHQLDWLHSPAARSTMERVVVKYQRFLGMIADHPLRMCVPTLDVDLGWHTHQLQPPAYYHTSLRRTGVMSTRLGASSISSVTGGKFIDHDDKLDEDQLHLAFEYTSKIYQEKYGEIYSECTCWYCEAVRAATYSSVGARLGFSRQGDVVDNFHKSGASSRCPAPDRAAHVSAHNAVLFVDNDVRSKVTRQLRAAQLNRLNNNYAKAVRRAERSGRKLPPREEYYDHWGYQYYMYSPYMYPLYFNTGYYYASPGFVPMGAGEWANCASGSCGSGGVAAGACGGPGGCGACGSISGGCAGGGAAGGCGGVGGGCGGGGGGCGGGGGGCGGGGGGCGGGGS